MGIGETELVALVGGGGKTSLMFALAAALTAAGRGVVLTTTTRISRAEVERVPTVYLGGRLPDGPREQAESEKRAPVNESRWKRLPRHETTRLRTPCLVLGSSGQEKAKGVPLGLPRRLLARPEVDVLLVEADGAKMLPVKAPAAHEPAVPPGTTLFVTSIGIDALDGPLETVAHRPHLISRLTGRAASERLRPADVATLLTHPNGGLKGAPAGARVLVFVNKVETAAQMASGREIAEQVVADTRVERVILGALQTEQAVRAVFKRPTGENEQPGDGRGQP